MKCAICDKPKDRVFPKESTLLPGIKLFVCATCDAAGMEPRYVIIIAGRQYGREKVWDYIEKKKYHGADISAKDLGRE